MSLMLIFGACAPIDPAVPVEAKAALNWEGTNYHGFLPFGVRQVGQFQDDKTGESWGFTLSDGADLVLKTSAEGKDLDTRMFLHFRTNEEEPWRQIKVADSGSDGLGEAWIGNTFEAGDYVVDVYNKSGWPKPFGLVGTCEGPGCPAIECDLPEAVPEATPFTQACVDQYLALHLTEPGNPHQRVVSPQDVCAQEDLIAETVRYADLMGAGDEATFDTVLETRGDYGTRVFAIPQGESTWLETLYTPSGDPIVLIEHGDTDSLTWTCGNDTDPTVLEPNAVCQDDLERAGLYRLASGITELVVGPEDVQSMPPVAQNMINRYRMAQSLPMQAEIEIGFQTWEGADAAPVASIRFRDTDTLWVGIDQGTYMRMLLESDSAGARLPCNTF